METTKDYMHFSRDPKIKSQYKGLTVGPDQGLGLTIAYIKSTIYIKDYNVKDLEPGPDLGYAHKSIDDVDSISASHKRICIDDYYTPGHGPLGMGPGHRHDARLQDDFDDPFAEEEEDRTLNCNVSLGPGPDRGLAVMESVDVFRHDIFLLSTSYQIPQTVLARIFKMSQGSISAIISRLKKDLPTRLARPMVSDWEWDRSHSHCDLYIQPGERGVHYRGLVDDRIYLFDLIKDWATSWDTQATIARRHGLLQEQVCKGIRTVIDAMGPGPVRELITWRLKHKFRCVNNSRGPRNQARASGARRGRRRRQVGLL